MDAEVAWEGRLAPLISATIVDAINSFLMLASRETWMMDDAHTATANARHESETTRRNAMARFGA
jgi:hypothetical protein